MKTIPLKRPRSLGRTGTDEHRQGALARLREALGAGWRAVRAASARRAAVREMLRLDDHLLADIGIQRSELDRVARDPIANRAPARTAADPLRTSAPSARQPIEPARAA